MARDFRDLSLQAIAERMTEGSYSHLVNLVNGRREIRLPVIEQVAQAMGLDPFFWLLDDTAAQVYLDLLEVEQGVSLTSEPVAMLYRRLREDPELLDIWLLSGRMLLRHSKLRRQKQ